MRTENESEVARLGRAADLLEAAVREIRAVVGTSKDRLDGLATFEAECHPDKDDGAASGSHTRINESTEQEVTMTSIEVAAMLKVHLRTLRRMRAAGEGPTFIGFGRSVRYQRSQVLRWLAERKS